MVPAATSGVPVRLEVAFIAVAPPLLMDAKKTLVAVAATMGRARRPRPVVLATTRVIATRPGGLTARATGVGAVVPLGTARQAAVEVVVVDTEPTSGEAVGLAVGRAPAVGAVATRPIRGPAAVVAQAAPMVASGAVLHGERQDASGRVTAATPPSEG